MEAPRGGGERRGKNQRCADSSRSQPGERELSRVRHSGHATDNEELELGVRCMAAGVYDDQNKLVAGLSISAPSGRLEDGWLPKLKETAHRISETLGHAPSLSR